MAALVWDETAKRFFETGVDRCVLYPMTAQGAYDDGVAWNGVTEISEKPSGAESNKKYADNKEYLNLISKEEFGASISAFTYPEEFEQCDGSRAITDGVYISQQTRLGFGLCYRTKIGNDVDGEDKGYKLHLVYNCKASPSEKSRTTINESPDALSFSWEITTTPVDPGIAGQNYKPTSHLVIDSRDFTATADAAKLAALEKTLYGDTNTDPTLPSISEVLTALS